MNHTKIIDIHSHFTTSEYLNMLEKHNAALSPLQTKFSII